MDSLQNILGQKSFIKPDEMQAVRDYISRQYGSNSSVKLINGALIVSVPNSSLAATLQLERQKIIEVCGVKNKLVIRNGLR